MTHFLHNRPWFAIFFTLFIIILFREVCVLFADAIGISSMGNIIGMLLLFAVLITIRFFKGLPEWLVSASNKILTESALAYLPVSAGAGLLLFNLGDEFTRIAIVLVLSTIIPLWCFAKLTDSYFKDENPKKDEGLKNEKTANHQKNVEEQP